MYGQVSQAAQNGDGRLSSNATPTIGWLDDAETRNLLSSLGLINEEGEWRTSFTMNPALDPAANIVQSNTTSFQTHPHNTHNSGPSPAYGMQSSSQAPSMWTARPGATGNYLDGIDRGFHALHSYSQYSL